MAFEAATSKAGPRKDVNVTPLIDVVLVLLIIFMVLTPSWLKHLTPTVAKDGPPPTTQSVPVGVELAADGTLSVNGATTAWERLQDTVRARLAQSGQRTVFFTIADEVDYSRAIRLMDLCKGAGAEVLGLPRAL